MKDPLETTETVDTRRAILVAVLVALGLVFVVLARPSIAVTVALIIGLIVTVMLHEAGHMIAAKHSGMKVTEFFVGFGPRIWSFRRGETEYGVKAIPAGGYVRILGMNNVEEVDPEDEARTYRAASFPKRLVTVLAGIGVNLLIAFLLVFGVLFRVGEPAGNTTTIAAVSEDLPAAAAGLRDGDRVVSINGTRIDDWEDIPAVLESHAGDEISIVVDRDGQSRALSVTPTRRSTDDGRGFIGIAPETARVSLGPVGALRESGVLMWDGTTATVNGIYRVFSPAGVERQARDVTRAGPQPSVPRGVNLERPRSVIGIVSIGDDLVQGDVWTLLFLFATINLFLALFNLIPLLPFDGGHAAIACYEAVVSRIRGREVRIDYRRMLPVTVMVFAVLLFVGGSAIFLDLREIVTGS
ncbi:MAG TPA: M50 family metallopeptidase [Acidimicrobiia bacterium]|nr:M50 family metallopeptidase [Acidimicrobiia bacterium]